MSTGLSLLRAYDSDDTSGSDSESTNPSTSAAAEKRSTSSKDEGKKQEEEFKFAKIDPSLSLVSSITVDAAPVVEYSVLALSFASLFLRLQILFDYF